MSHQKGIVMSSDEKKEQESVSKAFRKMKGLGFDAETVRPVLKRLVKLYNNDWTFIEESSYQNLVDAILEATNEENKLQIENGSADEHPSKKLRTGRSEDHDIKDNGYLGLKGQPAKNNCADPTYRSNQSARLAIGNKDFSISSNLVQDITNGTEKVKISLLKDSAKDVMPRFTYIRDNVVYQSACIQVSLARVADDDCCGGCKGNCLSSSIPCACARDTGGDFAYNCDGLLNENFLNACISLSRDDKHEHHVYCETCPLERMTENRSGKCKGHLVRKFIKECWIKCGCTMQCGNRVVQRGITRKIQVFRTNKGKGWGVRTLEKLPAGAFICEYSGEILTNNELYKRNKRRNRSGDDKHTYPVLLDADWASESILVDEDALCLDATNYGNVARFMNHRCFDGNMINIPVQVETVDRHYYHIAFFTTREVDALEELTWDYGIDFDDHNHPIKAFQCRCGSASCRDDRNTKKKC